MRWSIGEAKGSRSSGYWLESLNQPAEQARKLSILDDRVAIGGSPIGSPKEWLVSLGFHVIRLRDSNDLPHIIEVLSQT
jgi:hypothetical protein